MKKLYIILTHTGTALSRIIKYYTKDEFTHSSIALDADLNEMYSFGRINPYNPFWGSFVHEYINKGTFKRFKKTRAEVYSILVTDEQYEKAKKVITYFNKNKQKYKFNIVGLACVSIHKQIVRKNTFYCAEFVKHILKVSNIQGANELPEIIKPQHFKEMDNIRLEYEGALKKYKKKKHLKLEEVNKIIQEKKISYI
ncbi:MAG: hypothetical protein HFJ55_00830 [Clostridia bacterium]|nr:hypothetical protein [Clostridia bacterium]